MKAPRMPAEQEPMGNTPLMLFSRVIATSCRLPAAEIPGGTSHTQHSAIHALEETGVARLPAEASRSRTVLSESDRATGETWRALLHPYPCVVGQPGSS